MTLDIRVIAMMVDTKLVIILDRQLRTDTLLLNTPQIVRPGWHLAFVDCAFHVFLYIKIGMYINRKVFNVMLIPHLERRLLQLFTQARVRKQTL